jgi:dTMP kinase
LFISFEGIDKGGKSTQISLLADYLKRKKYHVVQTCEPGGTRLGKEIEKILLGSSVGQISDKAELFLYLADRSEHVNKIIKPVLNKDKIVISDRFTDASVAYQGYGRGLDIHWINELNKRTTQGICPELTFLLDIDPELTKKRSKEKDRIENEEISFHQRVRQGYLEIARLHPNRVKIINGQESRKNIHLTIIRILSEYL